MPLTITLKPKIEQWLHEQAAREGIPAEDLAARHLEEAELLAEIRADVPDAASLARFAALRDRLHDGTLTEDERREFLACNDDLEAANVRRMELLSQIARLRGQTLRETMHRLGIGPFLVSSNP